MCFVQIWCTDLRAFIQGQLGPQLSLRHFHFRQSFAQLDLILAHLPNLLLEVGDLAVLLFLQKAQLSFQLGYLKSIKDFK
jgi:hypothetical protein